MKLQKIYVFTSCSSPFSNVSQSASEAAKHYGANVNTYSGLTGSAYAVPLIAFSKAHYSAELAKLVNFIKQSDDYFFEFSDICKEASYAFSDAERSILRMCPKSKIKVPSSWHWL